MEIVSSCDMKGFSNARARRFVGTAFLTFLILGLISSGLPALLLILDVSSFEIGDRAWWLIEWQNDADGSAIRFNLAPFLVIAIILGVLAAILERSQSPNHPDRE